MTTNPIPSSELVLSLSIENLVNQRAAVIERLGQAVALMREASTIAAAANIGMPHFTIRNRYGRHGSECSLTAMRDGAYREDASQDDDVQKMIRTGVDAAAWQYLMNESGLRSLMDATARAQWDASISDNAFPELTKANIEATFTALHGARGDMFERGVIALFKRLAWCYKTNQPQKFGKRIVLDRMRASVSGAGNRLGYVNLGSSDALDDLARVFNVLDSKPEPDHRAGWHRRLNAVACTSDPDAADDYMRIKSYRNGNGHATFLRPDLVDKMNLIIAKHYPGALPAPK